MSEKKKMRVGEAAKEIGVSTTQMRRLDKSGVLVPEFILESGHRIYSVDQIQEYVSRTVNASQAKNLSKPVVNSTPETIQNKSNPVAQKKTTSAIPVAGVNPPNVKHYFSEEKKKPVNRVTPAPKIDDPDMVSYVIDFMPKYMMVGSLEERRLWDGKKWPWRYSHRTFEFYGLKNWTLSDAEMIKRQDEIHKDVHAYEMKHGVIEVGPVVSNSKTPEEIADEEWHRN